MPDQNKHTITPAGDELVSRPKPRLINRDNLHELFRHHEPTPEKTERHQQLRAAAYEFANAILALTPVCADQQAALRKVREALFTANAAIALDGMC